MKLLYCRRGVGVICIIFLLVNESYFTRIVYVLIFFFFCGCVGSSFAEGASLVKICFDVFAVKF